MRSVIVVTLHSALLWPHLKNGVQYFGIHSIKDIKHQDVCKARQQRVKGLEGTIYEEQLKTLGLLH